MKKPLSTENRKFLNSESKIRSMRPVFDSKKHEFRFIYKREDSGWRIFPGKNVIYICFFDGEDLCEQHASTHENFQEVLAKAWSQL